MDLEYDAAFTDSPVYYALGTGLYQTATFHLSGVTFQNGIFNKADFRVRTAATRASRSRG